ncbi:DUF6603 domain-containing protein [Microcoleus sp. Pol12B5]|uniref:DUF6603 domain-containing protein n=1 Tax=Microcoleus sp. Pol12B5 TaxID=3055396 RepID=UPI002FD18CC2
MTKNQKLKIKLDFKLKTSGNPINFSVVSLLRDESCLLQGKISSEESINIRNFVDAFDAELGKPIPDDIEISLDKLLLVFNKEKNTTKILICLGLGTEINLSKLPLIGKRFSSEQTVSIQDFQLIYASQDFDNKTQLITELAPEKILGGLALSASLKFSDQQKTLDIAIPKSSQLSNSSNNQSSNTSTPRLSPNTSTSIENTNSSTKPQKEKSSAIETSDGTKWFDLKKNFGPVYFQRVGVKYQNSEIWFFLDASISSAGLTLTLDGLSVGSSIKQFKPKFNLQGLGISYESKGGVSIGGAFLRRTINGKDEYSGALIVKTEAFTLTAIGSYTTTEEGHPSLFIYGILDKAIGGPPFFFITGLALGFGYNRSLILPTLDQIPNFPLVKAALNSAKVDVDGLKAIQKELTPYIPPKTGEIFLAVGIKFTSFKIIDSFALFVATFGDQFTLNLIGISTLISPPLLVEDQLILAKVRFALLARFVPAEGTLKVDGKILPDSYIFDKKCTISGGFAFYSWFKDPHEGDFVLTVGGYHPKFNIPPHYPRVDPVALNWQISPELNVKGSVYFALTASAIMAGGRLEAIWESGNKKAWFIANAHFIVAWQPYFYEAEISLRMGASYTFKIVGVRKTISVDLGANLHIWGPEFSGTATIDLQIISFTIAFGSRSFTKPKPLSWEKFKESFLPEQVCTIGIESGLLRKVGEGKSAIFIVNSKELVIATSSVIPIKTANANIFCFSITESEDLSSIKTELNKNHISDNLKNKFRKSNKFLSSAASSEAIKENETWMITDGINKYFLFIEKGSNNKDNKDKEIKDILNLNIYIEEKIDTKYQLNSFGIAPMNLNTSNFTQSRYNIRITNYEKFSLEPIYKNIPAGLWGQSTEVNINGELIKNVLSGFKIKPAKSAKPGKTKAIDRKNLAYDIESIESAYQWNNSFLKFLENEVKDENTRQEKIGASIIFEPVEKARNTLLQSLGLSISDIDLGDFNQENIEEAFIISPCLQSSI